MYKKFSIILVVVLILSMLGTTAFADTYVIKAGDTLGEIAKEYNVDYKVLAKINNIEDPNLIFPGKILNLDIDTIKRIDILTTNDFHGNLVGGYEAGAAKLAAYMEYYKSQNPTGTIILDGGDSFQGSPMSNLLYGTPVVKMMNEIGYAATVVGNHEFDWGIEKIFETMELNGAKYPMLTANIFKDGTFAEWSNPYTIIDVDGVKIGIIGLSTPDSAVTAHKDFVGEYTFLNPSIITAMYIPVMKAEGADIIVALTHLPARVDRDTGIATGELIDLAVNVDGIDAAVGGHAHAVVTEMVNDTPVVMAYKHGRMIGHITLFYDVAKGKVVSSEVTVHEVRKADLDIDPNAEIQAMVDAYNEELLPIFGEVLGILGADMTRDYNATSPPGNWFADVMREFEGVDVAFTNAGGLRVDLAAGEITMKDIYTIMPFDNTTVTTEMTGADILDILEQGCVLSKGMIQLSGLTFTYDSSKEEYSRVVSVIMADGTALDVDKTYTVVTNDFLAGGQDNYVTFGNFTWQNDYDLLRDLLADDLKAKGTLTPDTILRAVDIAE